MIGELVGGRWQVVARAGAGGMGVVYRALDRETGKPAALKVMGPETTALERFWQEAEVLADLAHPAVVRYLGRGRTQRNAPYLAMEWLEGEDLEMRLNRGRLGIEETLALARRVSSALQAAHDRGVVHRDLKPSNLFLVEAEPARVKLLDFGIARTALRTRRMTRTGTVLGTVGYMAPEQATGARDVDGRADLFALGCVLYECLAGAPAFAGGQLVAVLGKVLHENPPPLAERRPDVPPPLAQLVTRLLAKRREERPRSARALLDALKAIAMGEATAQTLTAAPTPVMRGSEQRLMSALLVALSGSNAEHATLAREAELARRIAEKHAGSAEMLANHHLLVTLGASGSASDQALRAAACALALAAAYPDAAVAVATGRAESRGRTPVGPVIERAAELLRGAAGRVVTDELTASFAEARFEVQKHGEHRVLVRARTATDEGDARLLLGKPTPCVGRRKELALLSATLEECIEEQVSRVVVVTAPAGMGKSRLRRELVSRIRKQGDDVRVLHAHGELIAACSSVALARQLVRAAIESPDGTPGASLRANLDLRIDEVMPEEERQHAREFLSELLGLPRQDEPGEALHAARNDPRVMAEWLKETFSAWLAAEARRAPLLVVLDDLQWADEASLRYVDATLERATLMVLGLGRPEGAERFAELGARAGRQDVRLQPLSDRAASELVRAALGSNVDVAVAANIVERADGNAFYLEELIRRVAEGGSDEMPETVLAVAESRIERLEPEARRVLRAASVFGEAFHDGGVAALLGEGEHPETAREWLSTLVDRELLTEHRDSRFTGQRELVFRHALLREAAYAMLADADRAAGHRVAGDWLEKTGERDPAVLASHFDRGGAGERAIPYYVAASRAACAAANVTQAQPLARRGIELGAAGAELGALDFALAYSLGLQNELPRATSAAAEAMDLLPRGSEEWFLAVGIVVAAESLSGVAERSPLAMMAVADPELKVAATGPCAEAFYYLFLGLAMSGFHEAALAAFARVRSRVGGDRAHAGWVEAIAACHAVIYQSDIGAALGLAERAYEDLTNVRDGVGQIIALYAKGTAISACGNPARTRSVADQLRSAARRAQLAFFLPLADLLVADGSLDSASFDDTLRLLGPYLEVPLAVHRHYAWALLAGAAAQAGRMDESLHAAQRVLDESAGKTLQAVLARCYATTADLEKGDPAHALERSEAALFMGNSPYPRAVALATRAEAFHALGRTDEAREVITEARLFVLAVGSGLEPELRDSWLARHANAHILRLAAAWLNDRLSSW